MIQRLERFNQTEIEREVEMDRILVTVDNRHNRVGLAVPSAAVP